MGDNLHVGASDYGGGFWACIFPDLTGEEL
jgi:hypothetical protein